MWGSPHPGHSLLGTYQAKKVHTKVRSLYCKEKVWVFSGRHTSTCRFHETPLGGQIVALEAQSPV